ncbi:MAG: EAL domain-containing protein [Pseudomonadota bacterium]
MSKPPQKRFADLPPGAENPLNFAISQQDQKTLSMVNSAVLHRQTLMAYQPVMRAAAPDKVAFYEGFIRVLDANGRVIPAADFMPAVEDAELGRQIDTLALRMGLRALHQNPGLRLALNMSARSIGYRKWHDTLHRNLKRDPTVGERLILEITEQSAMMVPELVIGFMQELHPHGVCFALDDFGAGYTAIKYFKDFDFDILKIDGQFVKEVAQTPDNRVMVAALLSIAQHFDMLTVAEAVETAQDAALLTSMGLDCLQGHYFATPTTQPPWARKRRARAG